MNQVRRYDTAARSSRVVEHEGLLYFTGHVPAGKQPAIEAQTKALLQRLTELLEQYGSDKNHILSAQIYLADYERDFAGMNSVWDTWIDAGSAPARLCIGAVIAEGYLVEIAFIAAKK